MPYKGFSLVVSPRRIFERFEYINFCILGKPNLKYCP
jgi:hypothetical protein